MTERETTADDPTNSGPAPADATRRTPRAEVRSRVLDAALVIFGRDGYADASLDAIATEAGFTKGALYSNFSSKADLFAALVDHQIEVRLDLATSLIDQQRALGEPHNTADDFRELGDQLTERSRAEPDWHLIWAEYVTRASRDVELQERLTAHRRSTAQAVARLVAQHGSLGAFSDDEAGVVVMALSNGLALEWLADPDSVSLDLFGRVLRALDLDGR